MRRFFIIFMYFYFTFTVFVITFFCPPLKRTVILILHVPFFTAVILPDEEIFATLLFEDAYEIVVATCADCNFKRFVSVNLETFTMETGVLTDTLAVFPALRAVLERDTFTLSIKEVTTLLDAFFESNT